VTAVSWAQMIDDILGVVESGTSTTVFDVPGPIAPLPDPLGGDSTQWPTLMATAFLGAKPKLKLLAAKANFLMLPKTIIDFLDAQVDAGRVDISETTISEGYAAVDQQEDPRKAGMKIPGASQYLAMVGYELGRAPATVPVAYDMLGITYHEMTHAWLWLQQYADADLQTLYANGYVAYLNAKGVSGNPLNAGLAFSEAAAYYVEDRIMRWCKALSSLDRLRRTPPADPGDVQTSLDAIANSYDNYVPTVPIVKGDKILAPVLSPALRDAIDQKVLDALPLTKAHFADTKLAEVGAALLHP